MEEYPLRSREIRVAVQGKYRNALAKANPLKRWMLRRRMEQEINRELRTLGREHDQELKRIAPDSALYFRDPR
jgi:hypothetical protein